MVVSLRGEITRGCGLGGIHLTGDFVEQFLDDCLGEPQPTQFEGEVTYGEWTVHIMREKPCPE
jgi:hypothetical protein